MMACALFLASAGCGGSGLSSLEEPSEGVRSGTENGEQQRQLQDVLTPAMTESQAKFWDDHRACVHRQLSQDPPTLQGLQDQGEQILRWTQARTEHLKQCIKTLHDTEVRNELLLAAYSTGVMSEDFATDVESLSKDQRELRRSLSEVASPLWRLSSDHYGRCSAIGMEVGAREWSRFCDDNRKRAEARLMASRE